MQSTPGPVATPEPATVEEAVLMTILRVGQRMRQRLPGEELELSSFALLKTLGHHGPMRLSALATVLDLDASTVSRHAKSLEDRELIERTTDPEDGRASRVAVSARGEDCLKEGIARRRELIAGLVADWDAPDRDTLRRLLHRLTLELENQEHTS